MNDYKVIFENFLKLKGLKLTNPRRIILEAVFDLHEHFDVDCLYDKIKQEHDNVSRATIYRTMPLLVESSLVKQSVRYSSKDHYEHIFGHPKHFHMICQKCNAIIEEDLTQLDPILKELADKHKFQITDLNFGINGLCQECRTK